MALKELAELVLTTSGKHRTSVAMQVASKTTLSYTTSTQNSTLNTPTIKCAMEVSTSATAAYLATSLPTIHSSQLQQLQQQPLLQPRSFESSPLGLIFSPRGSLFSLGICICLL